MEQNIEPQKNRTIMKKILFAILSFMVMLTNVTAQNTTDDALTESNQYNIWEHRKFIRLGYVNQDIKTTYGYVFEGKVGVDFTSGKSYFLHKKPILGMMKFAIDFGTGVSYNNYKNKTESTADGEYLGPNGFTGEGEPVVDSEESFSFKDLGVHSIDAGLKIGPSLTVNPYDKLRICAYFHFYPAVNMLLNHTDFEIGFMPYLDYGLEVSYKVIGIGVEARNAAGKHWNMLSMMMGEGLSNTANRKSVKAVTFYLAFRF